MNIRILMLLLSTLISLSVSADKLDDVYLPKFDIMPGMQVEWVAEKMIYNDHPMSVQNFSTSRRAEDVMHYFESKWKVKGMGQLNYQKYGDELVIGFENNGYLFSVQVQDTKTGSEGSLVVTRNEIFGQKDTKFPLVPNAHIVSRIHSIDLGVKSETITISTYQDSFSNKSWYEGTLIRNGWKIQPSGVFREKRKELVFQKGSQACQLTFIDKSPVQEHRSMVLIHWIKG